MKILLTGSNGFVGKNIKLRMMGKYDIVSSDRTSLDLFDTKAVRDNLRAGQYDIVIHSANVNGSRKNHVSAYEILQGNLVMFYNLASCKDYFGRMIYFGSGAEFHSEQYIPFMDEGYLGVNIPTDAYGLSKYVMSMESEKDNNIYNFRLFGVFGPFEEWRHRFISNAICRSLKGLPITIHQNVYFDYIWIDDLIDILEILMQKPLSFKHYNLCRGEKISLLSLAQIVKKVCNNDQDIIIESHGLKREYTGCNERMMNEIGGYDFTSFEDAIQKLADFYTSSDIVEKIDVHDL